MNTQMHDCKHAHNRAILLSFRMGALMESFRGRTVAEAAAAEAAATEATEAAAAAATENAAAVGTICIKRMVAAAAKSVVSQARTNQSVNVRLHRQSSTYT